MTASERFDRGSGFLDSFMPQNAEVHLAIDWRRITEQGRPIDVPINENRVRIPRHGEQKCPAVGALEVHRDFRNRGRRQPR